MNYILTINYFDEYYKDWLIKTERLGSFDEDIDAIKSAWDYMEKFPYRWEIYHLTNQCGEKVMTKRKINI